MEKHNRMIWNRKNVKRIEKEMKKNKFPRDLHLIEKDYDGCKRTLMEDLSDMGHYKMIEVLLENANPAPSQELLQRCLQGAAVHEKAGTVKVLRKLGAVPDAKIISYCIHNPNYQVFKNLTHNVDLTPYKDELKEAVFQSEDFLNKFISNDKQLAIWNLYLIRGLRKIKKEIERL